MKQNQALVALAALLGVGAVVGFAQAGGPKLQPQAPQPEPGGGVPKKPLPEDVPGDVSGNPSAKVVDPTPAQRAQATSAAQVALVSLVSEAPSRQFWQVNMLNGLWTAAQLIDQTNKGLIWTKLPDTNAMGWNPAGDRIELLLHENLQDGVVRFTPKGNEPVWRDLPLAGTYYRVARFPEI